MTTLTEDEKIVRAAEAIGWTNIRWDEEYKRNAGDDPRFKDERNLIPNFPTDYAALFALADAVDSEADVHFDRTATDDHAVTLIGPSIPLITQVADTRPLALWNALNEAMDAKTANRRSP